ncbi:ankyrin repeat-containing domain protein [Aspergillus pseudoustus]|uniref:Ankyrin repeat-containing domain protein n=1 Tax=Aspergillus pseudoustus TaxID=1810923 RepID=A0ABR4KD99_9EURO
MASMEWEKHKAEIEHLYLKVNMTLSDLMQHMSQNKGLKKTKSQYERQLKKWGMQKKRYLPRDVDWGFIGKRVEKRKRLLGKDSELLIEGDPYPPQKLRKALYGSRAFVSTADKEKANGVAPSPKTPEGIVVRTPSYFNTLSITENWAAKLQFSWNESMPWLRFSKLLRFSQDQGGSMLSRPAHPLPLESIGERSDIEKTEWAKSLGWVVPRHRPGNMDIGSRISATLGILMPEEYEGQHHALATTTFSVELYLLSNGLALCDPNLRSAREIEAQDMRVLRLLRSVRWDTAPQLTKLVKTQSPSAEAVAEKLFGSAVRLLDVHIVKILLDAGMDPDRPIETAHELMTPLQWAADIQNDKGLPLVELLLSTNADVNPRLSQRSALARACRRNNIAIIKILLQYEAVVDLPSLGNATLKADIEIFKVLLSACTDVYGACYPTYGDHRTGYGSILCAAVVSRRSEIIKLILESYPDLVNAEDRAEYHSPLELAAGSINSKIWQLLLDHGARTDRPFSEFKQRKSALYIAIECRNAELANLLVKKGARLDDEYNCDPSCVLAKAIEEGDFTIIRLLQDHGAPFIGGKISSLPNKTMAQYLSRCGILQGILDKGGTTILANALLDQKFDLAQWLIDRNIHLLSGKLPDRGTILGVAVKVNSHSIIETILAHGVKVTDSELRMAVENIEIEGVPLDILERLLLSFQGHAPSAVASAAYADREDLVRLLLAAGANPIGSVLHYPHGYPRPSHPYEDDDFECFTMGSSSSALDLAAQGRRVSNLVLLLQSYYWHPDSVGRALAFAVHQNNRKAVDILLKHKPNLNAEIDLYKPFGSDDDVEIFTAIQAAVQGRLVSIVRRLVEDPDLDINYPATGPRGRTALQHAVENGDMELITLLLNHGADVNGAPAEIAGATALQLAAIKGYLGIARKLINLHANVNAPAAEDEGRTALEGAAEYGRIDMLQLLLDEGALVVGEFGEHQYAEAVFLARGNGHYAAARLLESAKRSVGPTYIESPDDSEIPEDSSDSSDDCGDDVQ